MKLNNPFSTDTRWLFHDVRFQCFNCGGNGSQNGGIELNHTQGRSSSSPLNASPLCKLCHSHVGHAFEEESKLLKKTLEYLKRNDYVLTPEDKAFLETNKKYYD